MKVGDYIFGLALLLILVAVIAFGWYFGVKIERKVAG